MAAARSLRHLAAALLALILPAGAQADAPPRTVVLGGTLAEIIAALGAEDQLVGRDATSSWPESLLALPDVGYLRAVSAEGVLSLEPELIIADPGAGPEAAVDVLRASGVPYVTVPYERSAEGVIDKITATAAALHREAEGAALAARVRSQIDEAAARAAAIPEDARRGVLFVMSLQGGAVMVGGGGTTPDSLITMAGARNVAAAIDGYKVMTDEAIIAAAPDVILMTDGGMDAAMSAAAIRAHPALGHTPAAERGDIVMIDGLMVLGFGPRVGDAVLFLNDAFYPAADRGPQP
ncbi:MAG: ABC transporter substrate-binding protein [Rubellimicrobium sp.]|nr:ABC transporter substrate-binding protein [Rubellimicrobium sp.]